MYVIISYLGDYVKTLMAGLPRNERLSGRKRTLLTGDGPFAKL
jgi:hypothetical protein